MRTIKGKLVHNPNWGGAASEHSYLMLKQGDVFELLDKEELKLWGNIQLTANRYWDYNRENIGQMYWLGDTPATRKERAIKEIEEDFSDLVLSPLKLELHWYLKDKKEKVDFIILKPKTINLIIKEEEARRDLTLDVKEVKQTNLIERIKSLLIS